MHKQHYFSNLDIQPLRDLHGVLRAHPQAGGGDTHELNLVLKNTFNCFNFFVGMCACRLLTVFSAIGLSLAFSLETTEVTVAVFMLRIWVAGN